MFLLHQYNFFTYYLIFFVIPMRKFFVFILTALLVSVPLAKVDAISYDESNELVARTTPVADDYYAAGEQIITDTSIEWDFLGAAGSIKLQGEITQDVNAAAGNIYVSASVWDDLRVAGGSIVLDAPVAGDVIIFGGEIHLTDKAIIQGDVVIMWGEVHIDGTIIGNATINAGSLYFDGVVQGNTELGLGDNVSIGLDAAMEKNVTYTAQDKLLALEEIAQWTVLFTQSSLPQGDHIKDNIIKIGTGFFLTKWIGLVVFALLLLCFAKNLFGAAGESIREKPLRSFSYGLLLLIGLPVLAIAFFISVIGVPVWFFVIALYIFFFVFAELVSLAVLTKWIETFYSRQATWWQTTILIVVLAVPFVVINGLDIVAALFAWWAIVVAFSTHGASILQCNSKKKLASWIVKKTSKKK